MGKLKMFDNYKKMFWGMVAFLIMLFFGIMVAYWGWPTVVCAVMGFIFAVALSAWDEEEEEKQK